jgi:hypothetical protein
VACGLLACDDAGIDRRRVPSAELIDLEVDTTAGDEQEYVEDGSVCWRPTRGRLTPTHYEPS